jgi:mRNA-degrading endonuclease RelE of RelBE toxin-antitoxin system
LKTTFFWHLNCLCHFYFPILKIGVIYTQVAYNFGMYATLIELPIFSKYREDYLDDYEYSKLQELLVNNPASGDLIQGTGGLRKLRYGDSSRGKGKRGGLRIIYYWWVNAYQIFLFTIYNKNEMTDLSHDQKKKLKELLENEIKARSRHEKT